MAGSAALSSRTISNARPPLEQGLLMMLGESGSSLRSLEKVTRFEAVRERGGGGGEVLSLELEV